MNGTVTTPDATDTPEQSASFSINLDCVNKDGALQGAPINASKTVKSGSTSGSNATVDIDKARVVKSVDSSGNVLEDVIAWEDDNNKLHFIKDAQNTTSVIDPSGTPFHANSGIEFDSVALEDVAMEVNNKEVHLGLGRVNKPKWAGYTNHKGLNASAKKLIVEDAEVKYPSSVPYMYKVVRASNDGYVYGIELGGTQIWKLNGTDGSGVSASTVGTFANLKSIATDGSGNVFVLDQVGDGIVYKVAVSNLDVKTVTYTLGSYAGPTGSYYSDIEYTSTGTCIWLACHYSDKRPTSEDSTAKLLFKIADSGSSATVNPTNMMPNMSGGNGSTTGTWVTFDQGNQAGQILDSDATVISNSIQETFPRSLLKHPSDNDAIYWLARYQNSGNEEDLMSGAEKYEVRWVNRPLSNISGSDNIDRVKSVTISLTLALHRIKNNHSAGTNNAGGDFVPITSVYHPNDANGTASKEGQGIQSFTTCDIDSIGIDNTGGEVYLTKDDAVQKCSTDIPTSWTGNQANSPYNVHHLTSLDATSPTAEILYDVTPTGQLNRLGVKVNFGYVPSTAGVSSTYSADGTNFVLLRQSGTSGFDNLPKTFTSSSSWVFFKDNSLISLTPSPINGTTSELQSGYTYFYKLSLIYDGYQESNLSLEAFTDDGDTKDVSILITINDKLQIPDRASGIKVYRAESSASSATKPSSVYRLVRSLSFASGWSDAGANSKAQTIIDTGTKGASYEAESGLPESIEATLPNYSLSTQLNNQHYIGNCAHEGYIDDASSYIFVSKVGKFDVFDWVVDFIKLPTVPTALISFAGRVFAFDKSNTYRIRGGNDLYIEDIFEGVGCLNDDAVVSTDFGLFFADNNNIYQHNGQTAEPIGEAIVRGDSTYSWQNRDTSYYTRAMYDAKRRSVYFTFKAGNNYYAWAWNIPRKRWDLLSFGDTEGTTQPKGFYTLDDNTINVSTGSAIIKFLGGATKRLWTWVSKDLTMGNDTQEKSIKKILSPTRIKANYSINSSKPNAGSQLGSSTVRGTYRMDVNQKTTNFKVRLDANAAGDECGAVGILFRTKRRPR